MLRQNNVEVATVGLLPLWADVVFTVALCFNVNKTDQYE